MGNLALLVDGRAVLENHMNVIDPKSIREVAIVLNIHDDHVGTFARLERSTLCATGQRVSALMVVAEIDSSGDIFISEQASERTICILYVGPPWRPKPEDSAIEAPDSISARVGGWGSEHRRNTEEGCRRAMVRDAAKMRISSFVMSSKATLSASISTASDTANGLVPAQTHN